jgi:hypothetical protein
VLGFKVQGQLQGLGLGPGQARVKVRVKVRVRVQENKLRIWVIEVNMFILAPMMTMVFSKEMRCAPFR